MGWLRYIFLLNGIVKSEGYFWSNIGITWTIPIIAFQYILAPWVLKPIKKFSHSIMLFFITLLLIPIATKLNGYMSVFSYLYCFAIGFMIYFAIKEKKSNHCIAILGILSVACIILNKTELLIPFTFGSITTALIQIDFAPGKVVQSLINALDSHSYTVYLIHGVIFCSFIDKHYFHKLSIKFCVAFFGTIALTVLVHWAFEKPVTDFLTRKLIKNRSNTTLQQKTS